MRRGRRENHRDSSPCEGQVLEQPGRDALVCGSRHKHLLAWLSQGIISIRCRRCKGEFTFRLKDLVEGGH